MRTASLALLGLLLLAGCSSGPKTPAGPQTDFSSLSLAPTATTGIIRGVVVDSAIRPVPNVHVQVQTDHGIAYTNTSAAGLFGFDGLAAGTYFVKASKPGYTGAQSSVDVVAGAESPPILRILVTADPATTPYVTASTWSGFVACSMRVGTGPTGAGSLGVNACDDEGGQNPAQQNVDFPLTGFDKVPDLLQGELVWQSTQTLGSGLSFVVGPPTCEDVKFNRADGASPLVIRLNDTDLEAKAVSFVPADGLCYRVFSYLASESADFAGVVLQQKFDAYFHAFYNFRPADGWQFSVDGDPVVPQ